MGGNPLNNEEKAQLARAVKFLLEDYENRMYLVPDEFYGIMSDVTILLDKFS